MIFHVSNTDCQLDSKDAMPGIVGLKDGTYFDLNAAPKMSRLELDLFRQGVDDAWLEEFDEFYNINPPNGAA